jgi:hypothetical protein
VDGNGLVEIRDAVIVMQILTRMYSGDVYGSASVNENGTIGLPELIYILEVLAELRLR